MDCSWLLEDDGDDEDPESESDPEETQAELETRLYSIVHHSDLSQPLPPELAKHYSIQCGDDGKLTVVLNDSLEDIKSEEIKKVDDFIKGSELDDDISEVIGVESSPEKDDVIAIPDSPFNSGINQQKRFRYSDVNLDAPLYLSERNESFSSELNHSNFDYFKVSQSFLNKKKIKKIKNLVIPTLFQTDQPSDWRDAANESFISVGGDTSGTEKEIIDQMVCALKKANPNERSGNLYYLARSLFFHNRKKIRKSERRRHNKAKVIDESLNLSKKEESGFSYIKSKGSFSSHSKYLEDDSVNIKFNGCVSLNISPFKPHTSTVDLVSEDEIDNVKEIVQVSEDEINSVKEIVPKTTKKWKPLPKNQIPSKWSKKMTKFYTKPSARKMKMDQNEILENLKRNSTDGDWKVDPRDKIGVYERKLKGKYRNRKCPNCSQYGHLMYDCPSPRKIPTCFLCGLNYHTAYSCPNKMCLKCGEPVTNEEYECSSCYYSTLDYDTACEICGQVSHRSGICPDLWRSFHATVEGEKKIPTKVVENMRKYCCNCTSKGHFSHQCPFPSCEGERLSSFVTNYSATPRGNGTTEVLIPRHLSYIIDNPNVNRFLQHLSDSTKAVINVEDGETDYVFRISGTLHQCRKVGDEIKAYVYKRKRMEPNPRKRKRRRLR